MKVATRMMIMLVLVLGAAVASGMNTHRTTQVFTGRTLPGTSSASVPFSCSPAEGHKEANPLFAPPTSLRMTVDVKGEGITANVVGSDGATAVSLPQQTGASTLTVPNAKAGDYAVSVTSVRPEEEFSVSVTCERVKEAKLVKPVRAARAASAQAAEVTFRPLTPDATPLNASCTHTSPSYYKVTLPASVPAHCVLTVDVAALQGDPDVWESHDGTPGPAHFDTYSSMYGDDSVSMAGSGGKTYYIAVTSFTADTEYTISAAGNCTGGANGAETLEDGIPAAGTGLQLFKYHSPPEAVRGEINIDVTPLTGDPDMYVKIGAPPTTQDYDWVRASYGADSLRILPDDPKYCTDCDIFIRVVPYGSATSEYSITATTRPNAAELQAGVPYVDGADGGDYQYYYVQAPSSSTKALTLTVTAMSGDPDLYVGVGAMTHPTQSSYDWASARIGSDSLTIAQSDRAACHSCQYFVAVRCFGSQECEYNIVAEFSEPGTLVDGETVYGGLETAGSIEYYALIADSTDVSRFTVEITANTGSCRLLGALGFQPTPTNYTYETDSSETVDRINVTVPSGGCDSVHPGLPLCLYYVAVTSGWGGVCADYEIVANLGTDRSRVELLNGVAFADSVAQGDFAYYQFSNDGGTVVTFRITSTSGDPDLFVTVPPNANPSPSGDNANFSSNNYGDDAVIVEHAPDGTYFVGVYGFRAAEYEITAEATIDSQPVVLLLEDGVTEQVNVYQGAYQYLRYDLPTVHSEFDVSASCTQGYVTIVMSPAGNGPHPDFPTIESHRWSSNTGIRLPKSSVVGGQYIIGIYGREDALCEVVASSTASTITELVDGVPVAASIGERGGWRYYRYPNSGYSSVEFALTPRTGDPDLFISTETAQVNRTNAEWKSQGVDKEVILIDPADAHYCSGCDFYAAVYAFSPNVSYSIVATATDIVYLIDGYSEEGAVAAGGYSHFYFYTTVYSSTVQFTAQSSQANLDVYVTRGAESQFPTRQHYSWKGAASDHVASVSITQPTDPEECDDFSCLYKVSVYSPLAAEFAITATATSH